MPPESPIPTDTWFLSYSRADEHFALRFANDLRSLGVGMWIDQLHIRPSEHWDRSIERAIRGCRGMVVILSPRAVASENVADEISLAIDTGKSIIPIVIEACPLPLRLTRTHLIDATRGYEKALQQCLAEIEGNKSASGTDTGATVHSRGLPDPQVIATAKRHLASIVGPIAGILVDRAAARAVSVDGLYGLLMLHINNEADRQRFVALKSQHGVPCANAIPPGFPEMAVGGKIRRADLERIAHILTSYLGPIAPLVTRNESKASKSVKDLLRRLAATLRSEGDRADFLRRVETY